MPSIDVHVCLLPPINNSWLGRCLSSLRDEPVNIHLTEGIKGNTSEARTKAFHIGAAPYVSFIDPDDYIYPGVYSVLLEMLTSNPDAVMAYSDEMLITPEGEFHCFGWSINPEPFLAENFPIHIHEINGHYIHHLRLMRRDAVMKCLPLKTKRAPEPVLMSDLYSLGDFMHLHELGYAWRIHHTNTFKEYTQEEIDEVVYLKSLNC